MSLESLVPPLVLCQQLKPGDFPESALQWVNIQYTTRRWAVMPRRKWHSNTSIRSHHKHISAPTLEEILNLIEKIDGITFAKGGIYYSKKQVLIESFYYPTNATAALRLWMRVNGREVTHV